MESPNPFATFRKGIETLTQMPDEDWKLLLPHLSLKTIKKNGLFAQENKQAAEIGFVIQGMFRQYYTKDGIEKTTYFFFENHFISSYISCITAKPSLITIEALSHAIVVTFPYKILLNLFDKSMCWQRFGRLVAEYLTIGLEERMTSLLLQTPEERYINLLNSPKNKIIERVPQHYIANYLGITPVSMSRIRNRQLRVKN